MPSSLSGEPDKLKRSDKITPDIMLRNSKEHQWKTKNNNSLSSEFLSYTNDILKRS